jgi:mannose-6-phosphate isomerase-like protein (cupin superfamily)
VKPHAYALDVDGGERPVFGEATVLVKASTAASGGAFTIWEELPPLLDTPLHVHEHEGELFHILDGEHVFQCGQNEFELGPGGFTFLPRGAPHAHRRVVLGAGRFERTFPLPPGLKEEDISASVAYGVLKIRIPKPTSTEPRRIEVGAAA